jgi:hypothetical protein
MRIGPSGATVGFTAAARRKTDERREPQAPETEVRALIPVGATAASERSLTSRHPAAPFLAQLIATQMQAPQTRARRRAAPEDAVAVYRSMTKPVAQRRSFGKRA